MSIAEHRTEEQGKAERYLRKAGYKVGGRISDKAQDAKMVADGVHQHEAHLHRSEPRTSLKLKGGGKVEGSASKPRLDKFARGGRTKSGPSKINIVIATGKDQQPPQAVPVPAPRPVPVPVNAGSAPMPPPGAMPPIAGAMPAGAMPPRPGMKRGGAVKMPMAGSGGAAGRLEKAEAIGGNDIDDGKLIPVRAHTRRKSGGRV